MAEQRKTINFSELSPELKKLDKRLKKYGKKVNDGIEDDLIMIANTIRSKIVTSMKGTEKEGYFYKRGNKKHFPSKPFNPPAIDSGDLIKHITFDAQPGLKIEIGAESKVPYAAILEEGSKNMKPRPWLVENTEEEIPTAINIILDRLNKEIL